MCFQKDTQQKQRISKGDINTELFSTVFLHVGILWGIFYETFSNVKKLPSISKASQLIPPLKGAHKHIHIHTCELRHGMVQVGKKGDDPWSGFEANNAINNAEYTREKHKIIL